MIFKQKNLIELLNIILLVFLYLIFNSKFGYNNLIQILCLTCVCLIYFFTQKNNKVFFKGLYILHIFIWFLFVLLYVGTYPKLNFSFDLFKIRIKEYNVKYLFNLIIFMPFVEEMLCRIIPLYKIRSMTRPLRKLASDRKIKGDETRRDEVYKDVHEDSSTESTYNLPSEVEFPNMYNIFIIKSTLYSIIFSLMHFNYTQILDILMFSNYGLLLKFLTHFIFGILMSFVFVMYKKPILNILLHSFSNFFYIFIRTFSI